MFILSAHNKYKIRGGEDESRESEERILREMGHIVDSYEEDNESIESMSSQQLALRTIWSSKTYKAVTRQLQTKKYDIAHIQNFFPLISPSIHYAARNQSVPVIQTLRNYRLLCPNALFFRDSQICEDCVGKFIPYPGIIHKCYKGNRGASGVTAAMITAHRTIGTWQNVVDRFITLTNFAKNKFVEGGFPANKIIVKPNFVHPDPGCGHGSGNYAVFVGRLSVEKGLDTLLDAWISLSNPIPLKIIGDGPLAEQVRTVAEANPFIEWLGRKSISEVHSIIGEAQFLVFPSKWYETFGRVAVEAFAKGTPVIAAKIGAIAELINDGQTGLLFKPGNAEDLANKVDKILSSQNLLLNMRKEARNEFEIKYTADVNYKMTMKIYASVLDGE